MVAVSVPLVEPSTPAERADVCGRLGCRSTDGLGLVHHPEYGQRAVCWRHALELLYQGGEWV